MILRIAVLAALCLGWCGSASADPAAAQRVTQAIRDAQDAWTRIDDYEARFVKQETSEGALGPRETLFLKFAKPFKIFMAWTDTHKKGLQVLYERGQHDGKLAIHKPGLLLGLAPVVFLEQSSPWVREGSASFNIEDAGIGTFLQDFDEDVAAALAQDRLTARVLSEDGGGLEAEVTFKDSKKGEGFMARRVEVFFDASTKLPTRMALFEPSGELIGRYAYEALALNPGQESRAFRQHAHRKLFRLYIHDRG